MKTHRVAAGDTLAGIAQREYGDRALWPSLYKFNNQQPVRSRRGGSHIANPNRLHPGETIYVPTLKSHTGSGALRRAARRKFGAVQPSTAVGKPSASSGPALQPSPASTAKAQPPVVRADLPGLAEGQNPAATTVLTGLAWTFELPKATVIHYKGPDFTAKFFLEGAIQVQQGKSEVALKLLQSGAEASAYSQAKNVVGQLCSSAYVKANITKREVEFECTLTIVSGVHAPAAQLSAAVNEEGKPVLRGTVQIPDVEGEFLGAIFATDRVRVGIDIMPNSDEDEPQHPAVVTSAAPLPAMPPYNPRPRQEQDDSALVTFFGGSTLMLVFLIVAFP